MRAPAVALVTALCVVACATPTPAPVASAAAPSPRPPPFPPWVQPTAPPDVVTQKSAPPVLLQNGTILTAAGQTFTKGHILLVDGLIREVGDGPGSAPPGTRVVDATGMFITPGLIDTHSHMGVYPLPGTEGNDDGNEATNPLTARVWAEHSFWPQDPALTRAVAGGITSIQVLPGSANLVGGRSFTAKLKLGRSAREMRLPGAPQGLKMACGENPKRVYGGHQSAPSTRMGNIAGFRKAFSDAADYRRRWAKYARDLALWNTKVAAQRSKDAAEDAARAAGDAGAANAGTKQGDNKGSDERAPLDPPEPPARDLELESLAGVLDGSILVHNHCYRADEMSIMLDLAREYGFKIRSFHHALEAYKIRDRLAADGVAVSTWSDWWGFKMEAYDGVPANAALVAEAGARAIIHSDSESEIRHLNQEAAKAMAAGRRAGVKVDENEALRWITANPAWALGVDDKTGTLAVGKMADVVVWDKDPFSVYAHAQQVFIDGELVFERGKSTQVTDFEVGTGVVP